MKKHRDFVRLVALLLALFALLGVSILSEGFCDFYTEKIYPVIASWGRLVAKVPFPVAEILMYLAAFLLVLAVIFIPLMIIFRKKKGFTCFCGGYYRTITIITLVMLNIYMTNWLIPFHSTGVVIADIKNPDETEAEALEERVYTLEELRILREYIVTNTNLLAQQVERNDDGTLAECEDMVEKTVEAVHKQSDKYPRLGGYVPPAKDALCSAVFEWMNIGGYTYPYTMEITGNKYNDRMFYPNFYAHEIAHHFGYYKENDGEFLGDIICMESDDVYIRYSGFYFAYHYVNQDYWNSLVEACGGDGYAAYDIYMNEVQFSDQVRADRAKCVAETDEVYKADVSEKVESTFAETAKEVGDKGWDTQANILQDAIYSGVVKLLLQYYDGVLY